MLELLTIENLDRRKAQIQDRIRRIQDRLSKRYPGFVSTPRLKTFRISHEVLSLTITSLKLQSERTTTLQEEIPEELDYPKQNDKPCLLPQLLRKAFERQAAVEEELCSIRKTMQPKEREEGESRPSAPVRYFGGEVDMNVQKQEQSSGPIVYTTQGKDMTSPIKNSEFSIDDEEEEEQLLGKGSADGDNHSEEREKSEADGYRISILQHSIATHRKKNVDSARKQVDNSNRKGLSEYGQSASCRKPTNRRREDNSISKNTDGRSSSRFEKYEVQMCSPTNYLEKYIKAIKGQAKVKLVQKFDSIVIGEDARNRAIDRIEQRIIASMAPPETTKNGKHEKDSLMSSFDLQNKIRDTLIKKVFEMQDVKKYK